MEELKAQAAAMRDNCRKGNGYDYARSRKAQQALSTSAGRDLLERLRKLEAVAEAASKKRLLEKERLEIIGKYIRNEITNRQYVQHGVQYSKRLGEVNAELDRALAAAKTEDSIGSL